MTRALVLGVVIAAGATASALALSRPDPNSQAQADGCARTFSGVVSHQAPSWAYVNDGDSPATGPPPPPQWATGVVNSPIASLGFHLAHIAGSVNRLATYLRGEQLTAEQIAQMKGEGTSHLTLTELLGAIGSPSSSRRPEAIRVSPKIARPIV